MSHDEVDPTRIGLCGASYGAYLATWLASSKPAKRLLLRAPALLHDEDLATPNGVSRTHTRLPQKSIVLQTLKRFRGEVMIVESGSDEVISRDVITAYQRACRRIQWRNRRRARHEVIPGATHRLSEPAWQQTFSLLIRDWFADL